MGRKKSKDVTEKKKPVKVRQIERKHAGKVQEPWRIMEGLIDKVEELHILKPAKWVLLWRKDWKPDVDKVVTAAQVRRASEIDRTLAGYDLALMLPELAWKGWDAIDKEWRIFHELCHVRPVLDTEGNQVRDEKDRLQWRLRKHPITAFPEEIERYGLERVLQSSQRMEKAIEDADRPLLKAAEQAAKGEAEKAGQNGLVPKRVRLIHDCKGLGKRGSEHDVVKVERGQLGVAGPKGIVFWLREDDYEAIYTAMVQTSADWRKLPIDNLTLTDSVAAKCDEKDILTLGDFQAFQQKHGDHWARELGLRGNQAGSVMDAWEAFWTAHPEFCQETPKAA